VCGAVAKAPSVDAADASEAEASPDEADEAVGARGADEQPSTETATAARRRAAIFASRIMLCRR
jgi:hypothetical protein